MKTRMVVPPCNLAETVVGCGSNHSRQGLLRQASPVEKLEGKRRRVGELASDALQHLCVRHVWSDVQQPRLFAQGALGLQPQAQHASSQSEKAGDVQVSFSPSGKAQARMVLCCMPSASRTRTEVLMLHPWSCAGAWQQGVSSGRLCAPGRLRSGAAACCCWRSSGGRPARRRSRPTSCPPECPLAASPSPVGSNQVHRASCPIGCVCICDACMPG